MDVQHESTGQLTDQAVDTTKKGSTAKRWLHVSFPLLIAFSVAQLSKSSIGVIAATPSFAQHFGLSHNSGAVGWLTSIFLYVYAGGLLLWGVVLKRVGPRRAMLVGTSIWVVALAITPFVNSLGALYGSRALLAVGEACFYPVAHTLTARWFPMEERARANASWLSGIFVGSAVGTYLTTATLSGTGWRTTFFVQAAIALVLALGLVAVLIRDSPEEATDLRKREVRHIEAGRYENTMAVPKLGAESPYRNYRYWLTMLMYLGTNAPFYGLITWLPSYLKNARHIHLGAIGNLITVADIASIAVMLVVGALSDRRVRRANWALVGFVIEGVGILGVALSANTDLEYVFVFCGLAGNAWCVVTNWALLHSLMPTRHTERATGLFSAITNLAGAGLPALMGVLLTATGSYTAGFVLLFATVVLSIISCLILIPQGY